MSKENQIPSISLKSYGKDFDPTWEHNGKTGWIPVMILYTDFSKNNDSPMRDGRGDLMIAGYWHMDLDELAVCRTVSSSQTDDLLADIRKSALARLKERATDQPFEDEFDHDFPSAQRYRY